LRAEKNEVVAPLGRNAAGKSIPLKSLTGDGDAANRLGDARRRGTGRQEEPRHRARGVQLVHEERRVFGGLDAEANLASLTAPNKWPLDRVCEMSPRLKGRRTSASTSSTTDTSCTKATEAIKAQPRILRR
jgi:branched-chain amino acid transport system ATP-binding protein